MPAKRNLNSIPQPKTYICYICGREIHGDCEHITTKRRSKLHIHFECMPGKGGSKE